MNRWWRARREKGGWKRVQGRAMGRVLKGVVSGKSQNLRPILMKIDQILPCRLIESIKLLAFQSQLRRLPMSTRISHQPEAKKEAKKVIFFII